MKIGMNLLLWTGGVTSEHFPLLAKLKAAGFDGVELPVFGGAPADYKPIRAELDKLGLKCTTVTILTKETNAISPDAAQTPGPTTSKPLTPQPASGPTSA